MRTLRQALMFAALVAGSAAPASAQRILDWPLRTSAEPAAVLRGPEAAFWNPAAVGNGLGRGEVIIVDQRTPDIIGLNGFAAAGSWKLDERTVVGLGYQHVSIDDISETSTSPLPDTGQPTFSITQDQFAIAASHALGSGLTAGAAVRFDRANYLPDASESSTSLGAGFLATLRVPMRPALAGSVFTENGDVRYVIGAQVATGLSNDVAVRGGYGIRGGNDATAIEHRIGITGSWRQLVELTGGVASANAGSERSWEPVLGASLRVSRYELGVLRENLASSFGAAYSFRFRLGLK